MQRTLGLKFGRRMRRMVGVSCLAALMMWAASSAYAGNDGVCGMKAACGAKSACGVCGQGMERNPVVTAFFRDAHRALSKRSALGLTDEHVSAIKDLKRQMLEDVVRSAVDPQVWQAAFIDALARRPLDVVGLHAMIDQRTSDAASRLKQAVTIYAALQDVVKSAGVETFADRR